MTVSGSSIRALCYTCDLFSRISNRKEKQEGKKVFGGSLDI
jgi:hypothetical protein